MSASKLVKPNVAYKDSYIEAINEYHAEGRYQFLDITELKNDFEGWVEKINNGDHLIHKPFADWVEPVPETALWLVKEDRYIGTFNVRHRLNWHLEKWGGNINFLIRPSMRGKGFGKKILQKGTQCAAFLGLERALITVDPKNKSAIRIVEFCKGEFEEETAETEKFPARRRYWLDCS
jgi:predicted acetyltransferase